MNLFIYIGKIMYLLFNKIDENYISKIRYKYLKNKTFSVISNNCWAGWVYRIFNLKYSSPTIGLFIMPKDYLKFINNLNYYLYSCNLQFINYKDSKDYDYLKNNVKTFGKYPIGKLDDIEINFMHYKNEKEALEKWNRRCKRVNLNNLIIKFNDQNSCTEEDINSFNRINKYKKMICFTAKKYWGKYNIYCPEFRNIGYVVDDKWFCKIHLNLYKMINDIIKDK